MKRCLLLLSFFICVFSFAQPRITSFSPDKGPVGTLVKIVGVNFNNYTSIKIGGVAAVPISSSETTLVAMIMPGATSGPVIITTNLGTATGWENFTKTDAPIPTRQLSKKKSGTDVVGNANQGFSLALSADGNTAIVGGPNENNYIGGARIFTRYGENWVQEGQKLVGSQSLGEARQGSSVALNADGSIALIGGYGDNNFTGASWIFRRIGLKWVQVGQKLVGSNAIGSSQQGKCVSISADGNTVLIGGSGDNNKLGAVWVFTRNGDKWVQQGEKIIGSGSVGFAQQGTSLSVSADGKTAIVGGPDDNFKLGAAWIFTKNGNTWSQQGQKLVGSKAEGDARQGSSVILSADGNTAVLSGNSDNNSLGAVWIFSRNGTSWNQQGDKLVGNDAVGAAKQGSSLSLSADGNMLIVGGAEDNSGLGASWIFTKNSGSWLQAGKKIVGTGNTGLSNQGNSVSLSLDGNTLLIGGPNDNSNWGGFWTYTNALEPNISSFTPTKGNIGSLLSINGLNLSKITDLKIGGVSAVIVSNDGSRLTAMVMPGAQTGEIKVTTEGGTAIGSGAFNITDEKGVFQQQGDKLIGADYTATSNQGRNVSISADGNTVIIGAPIDNYFKGAAWIFVRNENKWSQQGTKLYGTGAVGDAQQGSSVAISADGNTALVGGEYDNSGKGAVWVFSRKGNAWIQEGEKLVGRETSGNSTIGSNVAISADGNTAILGGDGDNISIGAAWIFSRIRGTWIEQTKLVGKGAVRNYDRGCVAISSDGNTALIGSQQGYPSVCTIWIFTRNGDTWMQQGEKLESQDYGSSGPGYDPPGIRAAINANGNTAIVSSRQHLAAWVFKRSESKWFQQGSKLSAPNFGGFGVSVSLNADGNRAIIGAYGSSSILIYTQDGNNWNLESQVLKGESVSVSLSSDGKTLIAGGDAGTYSIGGGHGGLIFNFQSPLKITSFLPTNAKAGDTIRITGNNFNEISTVSFGGTLAYTHITNSSSTITAIVGKGSTGNLKISSKWGSDSLSGFIYSGASPVINSFTPKEGTIGSLVKIKGMNLKSLRSIQIGGVASIPINYSDSTLTAMIMPEASSGKIEINTDEGTCVSNERFVINQSLPPNSQLGMKLIGTDENEMTNIGKVGISCDGKTAIVGGIIISKNVGGARIFIRNGDNWIREGLPLVGSDVSIVGSLPLLPSVAISTDGNTAIVGWSGDNNNKGAAWIFIRDGNNWIQQGPKLVGSGAIGASWQGYSVSLSADGNTAAIGGEYDNNYGAVWIFKRTGEKWSQEASKLVGSGAIGNPNQGYSVSLSADGNTVAIGGPSDNNDKGAVWIFVRKDNLWSQQGGKLTGTESIGDSRQGSSVALSANGNTLIVGGPFDKNSTGAVWIFSRNNNLWSQKGSKLIGSGFVNTPNMGGSVSLSADGKIALVGGLNDNNGYGAAWIFTFRDSSWIQRGSKLIGNDIIGKSSQQGSSVCLSADGNTAMVGSLSENNNKGSARVYVYKTPKAPLITSFSPSIATEGDTLKIIGSNFSEINSLTFGNTAVVSFQVLSSTLITAVVGSGSTGAINLSTDGGNTSLAGFTYLNPPNPIINSFTPATATKNDTIVITGNHFNNATSISLGGTEVESFKVLSNKTISIIVGNGSSGNIRITTSYGTTSIPGFTFIPVPKAIVSSFIPTKASSGDSILIEGENLQWVTSITLGGTPVASFRILSNNKISAIIGGGATGVIELKTLGGTTSTPGFTYKPILKPILNTFYPSTGSVGSLITIEGSELDRLTSILIGEVEAIQISNTGLKVVVMVMPGTKSGSVIIKNNAGTSKANESFTLYIPPIPNKQESSTIIPDTSSNQGMCVSISADGNTALLGGIKTTKNGTAWIYVRKNGRWIQQGNELEGTNPITYSSDGYSSVSLSADGNTAVVARSSDDSGKGALWFFTRIGENWTQQGPKIVSSPQNIVTYNLGRTVCLSADGNTAVASTLYSAVIFVRENGVWKQQDTYLNAGIPVSIYAANAAISADGNTIALGSTADEYNYGAVWIFTRKGNKWIAQGDKLVGTGPVGMARQGSSVALSADGNTVIWGGMTDNDNLGAVWVFTRTENTWKQQGKKLLGAGASGSVYQGNSVSLSADGNTAVIGGGKYVFRRNGNNWVQQSVNLVGTDATTNPNIEFNQSTRVAISADATSIIVASSAMNGTKGAAWIFKNDPETLKISSFSPTITGKGSSISIKGKGLTSATQITLGGLPVSSFTVVSDSLIIGNVGEGNSGFVCVISPFGKDSLSGFTFGKPNIKILSSDSIIRFGTQKGIYSRINSYQLTASFLQSDLTINAPDSFQISKFIDTGFVKSITLPTINGIIDTTNIYIRFKSDSPNIFNDHIVHSSALAETKNLNVTGVSRCDSTINVNPILNNILSDSIICFKDSLLLSTSNGNFTYYKWNTGDTTKNLVVNKNGSYNVRVGSSLECLSKPSKSIIVNKQNNSAPSIGLVGNKTLISSTSSYYLWFVNSLPIQGFYTNTLTPIKPGMYAVETSNDGSCWDRSVEFPILTLGSRPVNDTIQIKTYPNPTTTGLFYVAVTLQSISNMEVRVTVADALGNLLLQTNKLIFFGREIKIPISLTFKGTAFVRVEVNGNVKTQTVILQ